MDPCTRCNAASAEDPSYPGLCAVCAWKEWAAPSMEFWNKVECIECELGRDCEVHPKGEE